MRHHVIYVPGVGDHRALGQDIGIHSWRIWGVQGHYHPVGWANGESFAPKLDRLIDQIDGYVAAGDAVSLVGFSAGASAVLNAFAKRRTELRAVVCISGKINHPATAGSYVSRNPAFGEALQLLQENLATFSDDDKRKLLTIYPLRDSVVSHRDAVIPGVKQWRTLAFSHMMSVAVCLTFYAPAVVLHCRRAAKQLAK